MPFTVLMRRLVLFGEVEFIILLECTRLVGLYLRLIELPLFGPTFFKMTPLTHF